MGIDNSQFSSELSHGKILDYQNMNARYAAWSEVVELSRQKGILGQIFGNGLSVGAGNGIYVESLYVKTYYSIGWIGLALALGLVAAVTRYIVKAKDRKTFYLMVMMMVILLGSGVAINSMERVQMSWFPLLFAGMVVSSVQEDRLEIM